EQRVNFRLLGSHRNPDTGAGQVDPRSDVVLPLDSRSNFLSEKQMLPTELADAEIDRHALASNGIVIQQRRVLCEPGMTRFLEQRPRLGVLERASGKRRRYRNPPTNVSIMRRVGR